MREYCPFTTSEWDFRNVDKRHHTRDFLAICPDLGPPWRQMPMRGPATLFLVIQGPLFCLCLDTHTSEYRMTVPKNISLSPLSLSSFFSCQICTSCSQTTHSNTTNRATLPYLPLARRTFRPSAALTSSEGSRTPLSLLSRVDELSPHDWLLFSDESALERDPDSYPTKEPKCDRRIVSSENLPKEGEVEAPELMNPEKHGRQCTYTFVAAPGERVQLQFRKFYLRGTPPECNHEYLDVYTEIKNPNRVDLVNSPFGGRYCGHIPPRLRISLYSSIIISFYTDFTNTSSDLFLASYKFFNGSKYVVGDPSPDTLCGFVIHSGLQKQGQFMTPTYPGVYPKNITCFYKFIGKKGQRVRLEFRDFDLFYGGSHCPFDQIKMFDGPDHISPLIGTYCGQQRNLVIFSSGSTLLLTFSTLQRIADTQNRGFMGIFNFSESYVKLDFIKTKEAEHIRGTECDQRILSKKESNGTVYSPNYPFPYHPNIVCRYFIYGLQDAQNLERVRLQFYDVFEIPAKPKIDKNCSDGYLRIYLKGQEQENAYDKPDYELCGKTLPQTIVSYGPRLVMVFSSGNVHGGRFKASYKFETEYKIPGTPSPAGKCAFTYNSSSKKSGSFNSPRHPSNYPSNTTCEYTFRPNPDEQVQVAFEQFAVRSDNSNVTYRDWVMWYGLVYYWSSLSYLVQQMFESCLNTNTAIGDWLCISSGDQGYIQNLNMQTTIRRTEEIPRPTPTSINTFTSVALTPKISEYTSEKFASDSMLEIFTYETVRNLIQVILTIVLIRRISCSAVWYIITSKILGYAELFVEHRTVHISGLKGGISGGDRREAVKYYVANSFPTEETYCESLHWITPKEAALGVFNQCGVTHVTAPISVYIFFFDIRQKHINFTLGSCHMVRAVKYISSTDFLPSGPKCEQFLCSTNNFCISKNLRCNNVPNCGAGDSSDEDNCVKATEVNVLMLVGVGLGISSVLLIVVCIWCHRKRVRRREDGALPHHVHVCERGARFASVDSGDRSLSPVLGTRQAHHLSRTSLRTETVV
ncbi:uncharacterized protein LOC119576470 [Penaeus monodon]|uniref:uncharacterized protein LOC119576470 n=1 Tax=Penaeus monodon TaxID=6687 RepID=UPI0018A7C97C|nr:uncharacterized protein LOC119576470 [Penaeus monodon]